MEVVSTLNSVSSENEKTTTACNFETMTMNSFHNSTLFERPNRKIWIYANIAIRSFMVAEL